MGWNLSGTRGKTALCSKLHRAFLFLWFVFIALYYWTSGVSGINIKKRLEENKF
jgi:hypothetical protein